MRLYPNLIIVSMNLVGPSLWVFGNSVLTAVNLMSDFNGLRYRGLSLRRLPSNVLTAQGLTFSDATGLDRNIALQVMGGTAAGRGHMSTTYPSKVLSGNLEPAFMIDLAKKDLDIAIKFSKALDVPISLAIQAEKIYADAQSDDRGVGLDRYF